MQACDTLLEFVALASMPPVKRFTWNMEKFRLLAYSIVAQYHLIEQTRDLEKDSNMVMTDT